MGDAEEPEKKRILKEEILGTIPAVILPDKKGWISFGQDCGLIFATKILIVAFRKRLDRFESAGRERYYFMKREWSQYDHKLTGEILSDKDHYSNSYIIPYSNITHLSFGGFGRIQKRSIMRIHTDDNGVHRVFMFSFATDLKTLEKDLDGLLSKAGVRVSHGEAGDF